MTEWFYTSLFLVSTHAYYMTIIETDYQVISRVSAALLSCIAFNNSSLPYYKWVC